MNGFTGMLDIFTQFERSAAIYHPLMLVLPGLVGVLLGIFLWLGGSLCARTSVGVVWMLLVTGVGIFFMKPPVALGVGLLACLTAMVIKRLSTGLLTSVLVMFMVFLTVCQAEYFSEKPDRGGPVSRSPLKTAVATKVDAKLDVPETFGHLKGMVSDVYRAGIQAVQALEEKYLIFVGVSGLLTLAIGCVVQRLAEAMSCAIAGVLLMWGGMVLMLLAKGAQPLTAVMAHTHMCVAIMSAMMGVGALEQLLFCGKPKDEPKH